MKDETESLVSDIQNYADGLVLAIQKGRIQEGSEYGQKITDHLDQAKQYLELKKFIPEN